MSNTITTTEQSTINVEFRIIDLLTIWTYIDDAQEVHPNDRYIKAEIEYLIDKIKSQLPDYDESEDYDRGVLHQDERGHKFYNKHIK